MRYSALLILVLMTHGMASSAPRAFAQSNSTPIAVAAGGLTNPRGFAFDEAGQLIVAEAGTGGDQTAVEEVAPPTGPYAGGATGAVVTITDGCPTPLASGLASARGAGSEVIGPAAVAILSDQVFVLVAGGGPAHGNPDQPAGIYDVTTGSPVLMADLGGWLRANPVATPPEGDFDPDGSWYGMAADPSGASLWVVESNSEQVLKVGLDGTITRIADLSAENQVPTAIAAGPDGAVYVGHLTSAPFTPKSATVIRIAADGTVETIWTGLTMVTGLAIDADGVLYASELSGGRDRPPFFIPGTGRIVRQSGPDSLEEVATQLNLPTALAFGPDGGLYVSLPAVGADSGSGVILRVETEATLPIRGEDSDLVPPACGSEVQSTLIKVSDLGFDPASITVPAGATVTWRNTGEFDHAVASNPASAMEWDSGPLRPGEEFSQTFAEPGSYPYLDGLFPEHTGAIEVVSRG